MKRKLIKRNKNFLSSKFKGYLKGYGSFQPMVSFTFNKDDSISQKRLYWTWYYNEKFFDEFLLEELNEQSTPV